MKKKYTHNILWLDDDPKLIEKTIPILEDTFIKKYQNSPIFIEAHDYIDFNKKYTINKKIIDYIFLDIDLGAKKNGIDIYHEIRETDQEVIIVFVSANLFSKKWEEKVEELREKDENLFLLPIPFPSIRKKEEFNEYVAQPIEKIIKKNAPKISRSLEKINEKSLIKIFDTKISSLEQKNTFEQLKFYRKAHLLNKPIIEKYHSKHTHIKSIILAETPNNIIFSNDRPITTSFVSEFQKQYEKPIFPYNLFLNGGLHIEEVPLDFINPPISTKTIHAQILELGDNHVILNCLLNEDTDTFQERRFDLEPLEEAVDLALNNIITITINTYRGERVFSFKNAAESIKEKFEYKEIFEAKDYSDFFTPTEPENDEDYL